MYIVVSLWWAHGTPGFRHWQDTMYSLDVIQMFYWFKFYKLVFWMEASNRLYCSKHGKESSFCCLIYNVQVGLKTDLRPAKARESWCTNPLPCVSGSCGVFKRLHFLCVGEGGSSGGFYLKRLLIWPSSHSGTGVKLRPQSAQWKLPMGNSNSAESSW